MEETKFEWDKRKWDQVEEISHVTKSWAKDSYDQPNWPYLLPNNMNMTEADEAALFHIRQETNGDLCKVVWVTVNKKDGKRMRSSCHPFGLVFPKDEYYHRANIPIASLYFTCDDGTVVPLHDDRAVMYHVGYSTKPNKEAKHHNEAVQIAAVLSGSEDHQAIENFKELHPDDVDGPLDKGTYQFMRFDAATNTWWTPKSPTDELGEHEWPIHLYIHLAFAGKVPLIELPASWDFVLKNIGIPITYADHDRFTPSKTPKEKRRVTVVVMSIEPFYSNATRLRMMVAHIKATESANVTFWNKNISKARNIKPGQIIAFKDVLILNTNPQYQYTATTNVGITVTDDAAYVDVTGTEDLPTPTKLKTLREALSLSEGTTFGIIALITDVAPYRYGEKRTIQIRDDSMEATATILFDPKLAPKIGPNSNLKGHVFSFCELSVAGNAGEFGLVFAAKERKTYFWSHMVDARSYNTAIFRWAKSLGLLEETDVSRKLDQQSVTEASTSAARVPTGSGTESTSLTGNSEPVPPSQDSVFPQQLSAIASEENAKRDQLQEQSPKRARYN